MQLRIGTGEHGKCVLALFAYYLLRINYKYNYTIDIPLTGYIIMDTLYTT